MHKLFLQYKSYLVETWTDIIARRTRIDLFYSIWCQRYLFCIYILFCTRDFFHCYYGIMPVCCYGNKLIPNMKSSPLPKQHSWCSSNSRKLPGAYSNKIHCHKPTSLSSSSYNSLCTRLLQVAFCCGQSDPSSVYNEVMNKHVVHPSLHQSYYCTKMLHVQ
jgi:hypothetical protein